MNLIAMIPLASAVRNATIVGAMSMVVVESTFNISYTNDAMMIGMDIRNENWAAWSRFVPVNKRVDIVVPLRDMPGMTAMNWVKPTSSAERYPMSRSRGFIKLVQNNSIAVNIKVIGNMRYVNVLVMKSLNNNTNDTVTRVEIINK